jgi:hypothetical protein
MPANSPRAGTRHEVRYCSKYVLPTYVGVEEALSGHSGVDNVGPNDNVSTLGLTTM